MAKITHDAQSFPNVNIFGASTTQEMELGAKAVSGDGSTYRYVKVGATALAAGKLYDGPAVIAHHINMTCAVAAAGATQITVTLGATEVTANQYAGGYIVINDVDGEGYTYSIKSHPAAAGSATCVLTLDDGESVQVALTANSQASLVANQYNSIIIHASTSTGTSVGVAVDAIAAGSYGWIKTRGVVSCLGDGTPAATGLPVAASATTAGCVTLGTGALTPVGVAVTATISTEYNPIFLTID